MENYYVCDMSQVNLNLINDTQTQPGIYNSLHDALENDKTIYAINAKMDSLNLSPLLITDIGYQGNNATIKCVIASRECYINTNDTITVFVTLGEYVIADYIAY